MRVFLVDGSAIVRDRLATIFSELPEIELVGQAQDVREATEGIGTLKPDAVVMEIRLPGGSGLRLLQALKKDEAAPVVIILTNCPYLQYRERCAKAGADFFLDKSTEFARIREIFRGLIQGEGPQR